MAKSIKYNEHIKNFPPGESIPLYSLCYIDATKNLYIASKQNPNYSIVAGVYVGLNQLQTTGKVENTAWNLIPGLTCYLGNAGGIIQDTDLILSVYGESTVPIGKALSATEIELNIEAPIQFGGEALPEHIVRSQFSLATGESYPLTVNAVIPITTVTVDTHNAISGGVFVAPMDGIYLFDGYLNTNTGTLAEGDFVISIFVNGVNGGALTFGHFITLSNTTAGVSDDAEGVGSRTLALTKGDVITFVVTQNAVNTALYLDTAPIGITLLSTPFYAGNTSSLLSGIYESGSNSNGSFIKYSDGTLLQWGTLVNATSSSYTWVIVNYNIGTYGWSYYSTSDPNVVLSVEFIDTTYTFTAMAGSNVRMAQGGSKTTTSFGVVYHSYSAVSGTTSVLWTAIGRWK